MKIGNKNNESKRKGYVNIILLLLTISLFISATYAWFTDTAFSKGNKVFAGNLYVDVIADQRSLVSKYKNELQDWVDAEKEGEEYQNWLATKNTDANYLEYKAQKGDNSLTYEDYIVDALHYGEPYDYYFTVTQNKSVVDHYFAEIKGFELYQRKFSNENNDYENYYIITDKDASAINLYNMEPGQIKSVRINYKNSGDLAFRAAGALKVDESFTGLETLKRQYMGFKVNEDDDETTYEDVYSNKYSVIDDPQNEGEKIIDPRLIAIANKDSIPMNDYYSIENNKMQEDEFNYRKNKLLLLQAELENGVPKDYNKAHKLSNDASDNLIDLGTGKYNDQGGHLEEILEVYILPKVDKTTSDDHTLFAPATFNPLIEFDREWLKEDNSYHDLYCFGTLEQFEYMLEHGFEASEYTLPEDVTTFEEFIAFITSDGHTKTVEEEYIEIMKDITADLYADYQRYLANAGGYCLPVESVKSTDGFVPRDGVEVKVYDDEDKESYIAKEIDYTDLILYMPEEATSIYQNASLSLSMGVTATQVEYEMDDTGYMLYDKQKVAKAAVKTGSVIKIQLPKSLLGEQDNELVDAYFEVINSSGNLCTVELLSDLEVTKYAGSEISDNQKIIFTQKNANDVNYGLNYFGSNIDLDLEGIYAGITGNFECFDVPEENKKNEEVYKEGLIKEIKGLFNNDQVTIDYLKTLFTSIVAQDYEQKMYAIGGSKDSAEALSKTAKSDIKYETYTKEESDYVLNLSDELCAQAKLPNGSYVGYKNNNLVSNAGVKKRHIRNLCLDDIFNYYKSKEITTDDVLNFIYGSSDSTNTKNVMLADAVLADNPYILQIMSDNGLIASREAAFEAAIRCVFTFDTSKFKDFEVVEDKDECVIDFNTTGGGEKPDDKTQELNIMTNSDELAQIMSVVFGSNDNLNSPITLSNKQSVKVKITTQADNYDGMVLDALDSNSIEFDIFVSDVDKLYNYTNHKNVLPLDGLVGTGNMYEYTIAAGTYNDSLKAVGINITPELLFYNRDVAKDVFETDDTTTIGTNLTKSSGYDSFIDKYGIANKGYNAFLSPTYLYRNYRFSTSSGLNSSWCNNEGVPTSLQEIQNLYTLNNKGGIFVNTFSMFSVSEQLAALSGGKVFGFVAPMWYVFGNFGETFLNDSNNKYAVTNPKYNSFNGGTYLLVNGHAYIDDKKGNVVCLINDIVGTYETGKLASLVKETGYTFTPNNKAMVQALCNNTDLASVTNIDFLDGQNPYQYIHDIASAINYNPISEMDAKADEIMNDFAASTSFVENFNKFDEFVKNYK